MPDRREQKNHLPLVAVLIAAGSFFLGPCFGAGVAVLGVYVSNQTRSAVQEKSLEAVTTEIKKVTEQLERLNDKMQKSEVGNGKVESDFTNLKDRVAKTEGDITAINGRVAQQDRLIASIGGMTAAQSAPPSKGKQ